MNHANAGRHNDSGQNLPKLPAAKAEGRFLPAGQGRLEADPNGHLQGLPVTVRRRAVNRQEQKKRERLL